MASQSQPTTTTDVPNMVGELLYVGATFGKSPLLSRGGLGIGGKGGRYTTFTGSTFPMSNYIAGDTAAQDGQTEDASIAAMTDTSYTATQVTNYAQIFRKTYVVSYAAMAMGGTVSGAAIGDGVVARVASMPVQRLAHMKQMMDDYEESALYGTGAAWTNAATTGAMNGLYVAVEAGSETAAAGADLSKTLIETELIRMAAAGAEFGDVVIACNGFQLAALNTLYGNAMQSESVGGTAITTLVLPLAGRCQVLFDPVANADDLLICDMTHFRPAFAIVPGKPPVFVEPLPKIAAGEREQLFAIASVDYDDIMFHGMVSGLATS